MPSRKGLENALLKIMEDLDTLAEDAALLASGLDDIDVVTFIRIQDCRDTVARVEALLAQVVNRGGLSWDRIAGHYEVSKQALHRRLGSYGDELYERAQNRPVIEHEFWIFDTEVVHKTARLGAAELQRRAADPQTWRPPPEEWPPPPKEPLTDEEIDLVNASLNAWPDIIRRPDDDY